MAVFFFDVSVKGRAQGSSAIAASAYLSRSSLRDLRLGKTFNFSRAHRHERMVADLGVTLPANAPEEWNDRECLWNAAESAERGNRAQVCRRIIVALPDELNDAQLEELSRKLVQQYAKEGMCVDAAIHKGVDGHNAHLHMLLTMRPCDANGFAPKSKNEYLVRNNSGSEQWMSATELKAAQQSDSSWQKVRKFYLEDGSWARLTKSEADAQGITIKPAKAPVQRTAYASNWNDRKNVERWRHNTAKEINESLRAAGFEEQVDHRSYKRQGKERIPGVNESRGTKYVENRWQSKCRKKRRPYHPRTWTRRHNQHIKKHNTLYAKIMRELRYQLRLALKRELINAISPTSQRRYSAPTRRHSNYNTYRSGHHGPRYGF